LTKQIMSEVDPEKPGVKPQPWIGIQYVSIPEFQDVGNQVSQEVVNAISGRQSVDRALERGQEIAQRAGELQKEEG
jgi:sorbitol/mannitol transport system substrate-binding protein